MTIELAIIIGIFAAIGLVGMGVILGYLFFHEQIIIGAREDARTIPHFSFRNKVNLPNKEELPSDNLSDIQPGIVYRPDASELEEMNKPQEQKDAEAAIADTIRNMPEPTI